MSMISMNGRFRGLVYDQLWKGWLSQKRRVRGLIYDQPIGRHPEISCRCAVLGRERSLFPKTMGVPANGMVHAYQARHTIFNMHTRPDTSPSGSQSNATVRKHQKTPVSAHARKIEFCFPEASARARQPQSGKVRRAPALDK